MDGFLDNDESSTRKIGVHIRDDLQVAIVSSDVITNSSKILENSQAYLEDTKNLLSESSDIVDLVRENAANVENLRHGVLAGRQLLQAVKEGKSSTRKEIMKAIADVKQEYEAKKLELNRLLEQERLLQTKIDEFVKPAQAS